MNLFSCSQTLLDPVMSIYWSNEPIVTTVFYRYSGETTPDELNGIPQRQLKLLFSMTSKMASWRAKLNLSYIFRILNYLRLANPAIEEMLESNENQTVHHSLRIKDSFKMAEETEKESTDRIGPVSWCKQIVLTEWLLTNVCQ